MAEKTEIAWCDATFNPWIGCTKVSPGCKHCYAERVFPRPYPGRKFTDVRCHPDRLGAPLHWRKPRMVFVNSMSDLFHDDVRDGFIDRVFAVMAMSPQHTFQILTKRPERMREYLSFSHRAAMIREQSHGLAGRYSYVEWIAYPLPHVWLGVSVEDQATADERIPILLDTPAAVRWISAEPLLGPVDFGQLLRRGDDDLRDRDPLAYGLLQMGVESGNARVRPALDWIVAGGESGPGARPMHPDWPRAIRDQCAAAGVPFFFKQWGEWGPDWDGAMTCSSCGGTKFDWASPYEGIDICGQCGGDHWLDATTPLDGPSLVGKKRAGNLLDGREHREFPR